MNPLMTLAVLALAQAEPATRDLAIEQRYLLLPVRSGQPKRRMKLLDGDKIAREFEIELVAKDPQFWAFVDVAAWKGKTLKLELKPGSDALAAVTQGDELKADAPLYGEEQRPQFHFTSRRGWLNDPNGMVYYKGEYHLYYQHNPYGWAWGNMHWGHAVSKDLLHWEELPIALRPFRYGDWAFSGSAVVDAANTSGFKSGDEDVLVGAYTSTGRGECILYSNDRGRSWTEYAGNPVVKHPGRDPRLLWHAPSKQWVMAVYHEPAKDQKGIQIHTSPDLKTWTLRSYIAGFYECPDLFELPADGDASKGKWVLLGADGHYLLGTFDGAEFKPEGGKQAVWHGNFYASQTFSNTPDGRRIQIGWARGTDFPGQPFNQQMNVPVELELKSMSDGLRMVARPVKEIESLRGEKKSWGKVALKPGENPLSAVKAELADLELVLRPGDTDSIVFDLRGLRLVYDAKKEQLSSKKIVAPLKKEGGVVRLRVLVDRGSVEVFGNGGAVALCVAALPPRSNLGYAVTVAGGDAQIESLDVWELRSTWK